MNIHFKIMYHDEILYLEQFSNSKFQEIKFFEKNAGDPRCRVLEMSEDPKISDTGI